MAAVKPLRERRYSKVVSVAIYRAEVLMVIGGTQKQVAEELADLLEIEPENHDELMALDIAGKCFFPSTPGNQSCAIWLPAAPVTPLDFGTVAHEALHAAAHILTTVGVEWTAQMTGNERWANDEAYCYLTGYLTEEYLRLVEGVTKPGRR
jgi:hypothetical protein